MAKECKKCGECCKSLDFNVPNMDRNLREYYLKRGCKVEGKKVTVPHVCKYLDENNLCKIHKNKPLLCKIFRGQSKGFSVPKECGFR